MTVSIKESNPRRIEIQFGKIPDLKGMAIVTSRCSDARPFKIDDICCLVPKERPLDNFSEMKRRVRRLLSGSDLNMRRANNCLDRIADLCTNISG